MKFKIGDKVVFENDIYSPDSECIYTVVDLKENLVSDKLGFDSIKVRHKDGEEFWVYEKALYPARIEQFVMSDEEIDAIFDAVTGEDGVPMISVAESILAQEREYERGYHEGYESRKIEESKSAKAVVDCEKDILADEYERGQKDGFEAGMNTAWQTARKIMLDAPDGGIVTTELLKIFGNYSSPYNLLKTYSAIEAFDKVKAYEKEPDEVYVGDEIENSAGTKAVVTRIDAWGRWEIINDCGAQGKIEDERKHFWKKTGKYYDLKFILEGLKEG